MMVLIILEQQTKHIKNTIHFDNHELLVGVTSAKPFSLFIVVTLEELNQAGGREKAKYTQGFRGAGLWNLAHHTYR